MIKVGTIFYQITNEDNGKPVWEEWHVRTIRGGKITAIWKTSFTWGKRSTKIGDFGWLDPIPSWCRKTWRIDGATAWGIYPSKKAALANERKNPAIPDDFDTLEQFERFSAGLKRMRK